MSSREPDSPRRTFHAPGPRVAWFSDVICRHLPSLDEPLRVLDIGCGTGDQLFDLASRLPRALFVGVDVARPNIEAAIQRQVVHADGHRVAFEAADYRTFRAAAPFHLVITYSVLQFVPGGTELLASRVSEDVARGGLFVNVMPYRCAYNDALGLVRRGLRAVRSRATDRVLLGAARLLYRGTLDPDLIAERLDYTYAVPNQFDDELARALGARGFHTQHRELAAHASAAQMKHALRVMRRAS